MGIVMVRLCRELLFWVLSEKVFLFVRLLNISGTYQIFMGFVKWWQVIFFGGGIITLKGVNWRTILLNMHWMLSADMKSLSYEWFNLLIPLVNADIALQTKFGSYIL